MFGAVMLWAAAAEVVARSEFKPGDVIPVARPGDIFRYQIPTSQAAPDCEGCGAPGVRYTHHCEYCKRPR